METSLAGRKPGLSARPPLRERKREQLRLLLHEVAVRLFDERGYANVSVEEIADAAGVSPRTFFRYFPVKEDVVFAHNAALLDRLQQELDAGDPAQPVMERVSAAFDVALRELFAAGAEGLAPLIAREPALATRLETHNLLHEDIIATFLAREAGGDPGRAFRARLMAAAILGAMARARREAIHGTLPVGADSREEAIALVRALQVAWDALMSEPANPAAAAAGT